MSKLKNLLPVLLLSLFAAGCTSLGNLSPGQYPRNASGFYRVEASWKTREANIIPDSIVATVLVNDESYGMQRVPVVQDRWEGYIPIPPAADEIRYRFKFVFEHNQIGRHVPDSLMSPEYVIKIKH
jgi:hypothetical protein